MSSIVNAKDRLILSQVVYQDLRTIELNDSTDFEEIVEDTWKSLNFKNADENGERLLSQEEEISKSYIRKVLNKYEIVESIKSDTDSVTVPDEQDDGFYAAAFQHKESGEVVMAIRGSDPSLWHPTEDIENWVNDWLETNLGELPLPSDRQNEFTRLEKAKDFFSYIKNDLGYDDISITGHSMGGALAQKLTVDMVDRYGIDIQCNTFNGPGMLHSFRETK